MADEYGGWDWGGGGDYADYSAPADTGWDWGDWGGGTSYDAGTDWNYGGDWGGGGYDAPAPQPSWEQNYDWSSPALTPTPSYDVGPDVWGPPADVPDEFVQQWNQWQMPEAVMPPGPVPGLQGVDTARPETLLPWDYSQGEAAPDPMSVPRPAQPWGMDTLPSQEDPRWFSIHPGFPTPPPEPTEWQIEAQNRQQARSMYAGGPDLSPVLGDYAPTALPPQGVGSEAVADWFLARAGGDPARALGEITRWRMGPQDTPEIRDASHDLWTRTAIAQNPFLARLSAPILSPGYSAAKGLAQGVNALNPYLGAKIDPWLSSIGMEPWVAASRPSLSEVWSGMRPAFRR